MVIKVLNYFDQVHFIADGILLGGGEQDQLQFGIVRKETTKARVLCACKIGSIKENVQPSSLKSKILTGGRHKNPRERVHGMAHVRRKDTADYQRKRHHCFDGQPISRRCGRCLFTLCEAGVELRLGHAEATLRLLHC